MLSYIIFKVYQIKIKLYSFIVKQYLNAMNVKYGKNLKILYKPTIVKHKTATILLGENVTLNSDKKYYHLSMYSSVKLVGDKANSKISIGDNTRINGSCVHAFNKIEIGKNCLVAANTQIIDSNGHLLSMESPSDRIKTQDVGEPILIEDNVWIGTGCIILGGTKIGHGSVISANSVVKGDVPPKSIFGGNPAKLIKQY